MVLKLLWAQKAMLSTFEKCIFKIFVNFSLSKLKPFPEKVKESINGQQKESCVIGRLLKNGFEATLSSRTNVASA